MARSNIGKVDLEYLRKNAETAASDLYMVARLGAKIPEYDRTLDKVRESLSSLQSAGDSYVLARLSELYSDMGKLAKKMGGSR